MAILVNVKMFKSVVCFHSVNLCVKKKWIIKCKKLNNEDD